MQCPKCSEPSPGGVSFCRRCGTALPGWPGAAPIIIGRDADSTLQINHPRISSRHASLAPQPDGRYFLRDLGSVNGVCVGRPGNRVKSALVSLDEVIYLADQSFRVAEIVGGLCSGEDGPARLRLGRGADNDIVIKDDSVSRHHAVLERDARSVWWLEDLGSHNGTRVNGRPVTRRTVSAADALAFGRYETKAGALMAQAPAARAGSRPGRRAPGPEWVNDQPQDVSAGIVRPGTDLITSPPFILLAAVVVVLAAVFLLGKFNPTLATRGNGGQAENRPGAGYGDQAKGLSVHNLAEQATVFVIVPGPDGGGGFGTGFFIADGLVMTNRHVAGGRGGKAFIINQTLGRLLEARVVASGLARRDYAVLSTEPVDSIIPLKFDARAKRGDRVAAWGYPGFVIKGDPKLQTLLIEGDLSVAPEVVLTSGEISAVHETDPPTIIHTALISQGNSGGPLVNERGEVVGINTSLKIDDPRHSNRQSFLALSSSDLVNFLRVNDVPHTVAE